MAPDAAKAPVVAEAHEVDTFRKLTTQNPLANDAFADDENPGSVRS